MIASFSALGINSPSIALIFFVGSVLWSNVSKLSLLCPFMFVSYSVDLIVHLLQGGRGRVSGFEVILCCHIFQYICWNRLCVESVLFRVYVV